ncbi:MAG: molybdopterin-dependent oxidoreductase [Bacteroidales bacterium]|jgi:thiosulfate reductase/polysulfide reductase chain A|nr:molybdopterin-dependent oxidoreductase [Bacteroidales bacterium]NPV36255.1 molybdopterin-dependent oxidoreductase [Bacteroidales bacterium]
MKTRREFIKISALGLGGVAALSSISPLTRGASAIEKLLGLNRNKPRIVKRVPSYCEVCFWKCALWADVDDSGRVVNLTGNADDPHCNGRLCPRGTGGIGMLYDEDRLKKPLIRVNGENGQTFREASWEEALDLVANKLKEIADKYGPESIALFNHGSPGHHLGHLLKALGSDNIAAPSYAQCRGPREVGFEFTFGTGVGSPEPTDIRDTRCLVLIGSHIGENMHNGQVQEMSDAIDRGATIITVDPRFSTAASKSKYWLPIKPATDIALLLAWINVLITEELYDKDFVEKYTTGFDKLKSYIRPFTPEWAYGITTLEPDLIRKTAREMGSAAPAVIVHPGRHVTWYGDDTQRARAVAILNALLGNWGRRGGFYFKEAKPLPEYPTPEYPKPSWSWKDVTNDKYPAARLSVSNALIDASIHSEDKPARIKAWLVAGTNLPLTIPQKDTLEKAFQDIEFLMVLDTMPMEITGYADVVLPECTYLERDDDIRNEPHRELNIAVRLAAMEPMYDTKPGWWVARELGLRLGLEKYFPWKEYREVIEWQLSQIGTSVDEMQRLGVKKFEGRKTPLYAETPEDYQFKTPSGKIELYSEQLESMGFDAIPRFTQHPEPPEGYYRLIYGRAPMHTFSRTANNPYLVDLMKENSVWVNPRVAALWGLKNGQYVWLKNQDGVVSHFPTKVRITERIRWDSVYIVHGFGHHDKKLSRAYGRGANDTELITRVSVDPLMGGTGMRGNFVTFVTENPGKEVVS